MASTPAHDDPSIFVEKRVCPRCYRELDAPRCSFDQAYTLTQAAFDEGQSDPMLGTEIGGRYGLIERLGMGGMGAVYKGVDLKRKLTVAIKVLRESYAKHPAIRERFVREAEAGASLSHPNVVPLIDFGIEQSGRLWLAMEYVQGWTLRDEINNRGAFSVKSAIELTRQVLKGLAAAHDAGLVHRDLKHDNIMYRGGRDNFVARIVDFGIVKSEAADLMRARPKARPKAPQPKRPPLSTTRSEASTLSLSSRASDSHHASPSKKEGAFDISLDAFDDDFDLERALEEAQAYADGAPIKDRLQPEPPPQAAQAPSNTSSNTSEAPPAEIAQDQGEPVSKELTMAGMMVGSPSYMAPEQIRGLKVGPPADLYALAVVLYEVLAARRLFTVNDYETLLKEGAKRDAPRLVFTAKGEVVPEAFADLIHRALAHDPTDRYPDAHTMLLALDQLDLRGSRLPLNLLSRLPSFTLDEQARQSRPRAEHKPLSNVQGADKAGSQRARDPARVSQDQLGAQGAPLEEPQESGSEAMQRLLNQGTEPAKIRLGFTPPPAPSVALSPERALEAPTLTSASWLPLWALPILIFVVTLLSLVLLEPKPPQPAQAPSATPPSTPIEAGSSGSSEPSTP